jgi:hypothetical protein
MGIAFPQRLAQRAILFPQIANIQLFVDDHPHFGERKRLQHVIAGAGFHGFHRGLHAAKCGHHDDGKRCVLALDGLQKFQPIHARQFQIGHDQINGILAQQLESGFRILGGKRGESILAEI